jgi:hypothetical protein
MRPRSSTPPTLLAMALLVLAAGCSRSVDPQSVPTPTERTYRLSQVDVPPRFMNCSAYEPPTSMPGPRLNVRIRFDVSATGQAVNAMVVRADRRPGAPAITTHALSVASTCRYEPARIGETAVAVRGIERWFVFRY